VHSTFMVTFIRERSFPKLSYWRVWVPTTAAIKEALRSCCP
jgi:hypothetical protein